MNPPLIPIIISSVAIAFWIWMAVDFVRNDRIPPTERFYWILGFVFLSLLTASFYYFTYYRDR